MSDVAAEAGRAEHAHEEHRDYEGAKLGMWLFLFSECMLFGGLFVLYAMYRADHPRAFSAGGGHMDAFLGVANTLVLLTGSFAVASSITALQRGRRKLAMGLVGTTILTGVAFMIVKAVEWSGHIRQGYFPHSHLLQGKPGEQLFFSLYYVMTGLHGLHVIAGIAVLTAALILMARGKVTQEHFVFLENAALYWHLVDIIWIFLLPLFYLAA
ncbi:MAG: cytochrome c oxidase subunit 3 family protein [Acidobacteriota bacterium]